MFSAIILVNTEAQSQEKTLKKIKIIEGVEEAHALCGGVYDLIVKIKTTSIERLKNIIKSGIRATEGVTSTLSLMLIEEPTPRIQRFGKFKEALSDQVHFEPMIIEA